MDGNPKIILGLVWRLILNFEVMQTKKDLLEWAQSVTQDCEGVAVRDFTHSWKDGRAFCAIISKHRLVITTPLITMVSVSHQLQCYANMYSAMVSCVFKQMHIIEFSKKLMYYNIVVHA